MSQSKTRMLIKGELFKFFTYFYSHITRKCMHVKLPAWLNPLMCLFTWGTSCSQECTQLFWCLSCICRFCFLSLPILLYISLHYAFACIMCIKDVNVFVLSNNQVQQSFCNMKKIIGNHSNICVQRY